MQIDDKTIPDWATAKESYLDLHTRYGQDGVHRAHLSWRTMLLACYDPKHSKYKQYGGSGIKVEIDWLDFRKFFADMGPRPYKAALSRLNKAKSYSFANCGYQHSGEPESEFILRTRIEQREKGPKSFCG